MTSGFDMGMDEFGTLNAQAAQASPFGRVLQGAGLVGEGPPALQQVIFGGISALEDLATGQDAGAASGTFTQGTRAGLSYLTYGGDQAAGLGKGDPRSTAIQGHTPG